MRNSIAILCIMLTAAVFAHAQDTSRRSRMLPEISISDANSVPDTKTAQTPTQTLTAHQMEQLGSIQLSDAVKQLVGVVLKDYGGIGGMKTVSARGLGSQFTTLSIDGVAVTDCQNGQVDLSRYLIGNSSHVSLANGQYDNLLQSARSYAAGSVLNMETREPEFSDRGTHINMSLDEGSFGYISPTLLLEQRITDKLSVSAWGNYARSNGNYPFTLYYTATRNDSCSREQRTNSQMSMGTADANLFYRISSAQLLQVKVHYMQGFHALPGPVTFYTTRGSEHSEEQLFFAQGRYRINLALWNFQALAKYQSSKDIYEDTATFTSPDPIRNEYLQREFYLSQAAAYTLPLRISRLSIRASADESSSHLLSNLNHDNNVRRIAMLGILSLHYDLELPKSVMINIDGHLLGTHIQDIQEKREGVASGYQRLSPYAGISLHAGPVLFRYFYKETYRVPNFNELYYYTIGRSLYPERARQHNIGLVYSSSHALSQHLSENHTLSLDIYRNLVSDKIIAIPTINMYLWSMTNLGEAQITGVDVSSSARLFTDDAPKLAAVISGGYSYQKALDKTDPDSKCYNNQIPYTPKHSGTLAITFENPWIDIGYSATFVGKRYCMQQNTPATLVHGYTDHGVTFSHTFPIGQSPNEDQPHQRQSSIKVKLQILNLFDTQYEVIRSYPMMGRNSRIGFSWTF